MTVARGLFVLQKRDRLLVLSSRPVKHVLRTMVFSPVYEE